MNRRLIQSIAYGYVLLALLIFWGIKLNQYALIFISTFTLFLTMGQFFRKATSARTNGKKWQEQVKKGMVFFGDFNITCSVPISIIITIIVIGKCPEYGENIINSFTFFTLAFVFFTIESFED